MRTLLGLVCLFLLSSAALAQNEGFNPPTAIDLDPDPDVVEVELTAQVSTWEYVDGIGTDVYTYNGTIPGPTIEGKVGNLIRVHFTNDLPEPTTIHWHGVEIPANMDGSHISQLVVQPGETFDYEFRLLRDGMCWYHPHVRTFDQVELGLYGVLMSRDPEIEGPLGLDDLEEHIVVFDDVMLDDDLQVMPAFPYAGGVDPLKNSIYQLSGREGTHLLINGKVARSRSLTLENGKMYRWRVLNASNTTFCRLDLATDMVAPMWMVGADAGINHERLFRPPVVPVEPPPEDIVTEGPGAGKVRGVTSDQLEMYEDNELEDPSTWRELHNLTRNPDEGIFLLPAERMDVVFVPIADENEIVTVFNHDWPRGRHDAFFNGDGSIGLIDDRFDGVYPIRPYMDMTIVGPDPGKPYPKPPRTLRQIEFMDPSEAVGVLPVTFGHAFPDDEGEVTAFAQAKFVDDGNGGTSMVPLPAKLVDSFEAHDVEVGETWIWEITNLTHGDHPFHTHGFFFQPYEIQRIDDVIPENNSLERLEPMFKDTIRVPARLNLRGSSRTIVRALVRFDETGRENQIHAQGDLPTFDENGDWTSGGWLFHCHILEHAAGGMLSYFEVHDPDDPFWLLGKALAGTNGRPSLTANGDLTPGSKIDFHLVDGLPGAGALLAVGTSFQNLPLLGGTLVPAVESIIETTTDVDGHATWSLGNWDLFPSGTTFYVQVGFLDPGAPEGLALSNALKFVVP